MVVATARMPAWLLVKLSLFSDERFRERWLVDALGDSDEPAACGRST